MRQGDFCDAHAHDHVTRGAAPLRAPRMPGGPGRIVRATFARTGSHVCWDVYTLQDTAGEENASTQARQCFQLLAN